jgi:hypothetical protein
MSDPEDENPQEAIVEEDSQVHDSQIGGDPDPNPEDQSEPEDSQIEKSDVTGQDESDKQDPSLNPDKSQASIIQSQPENPEPQANQSLEQSFKGDSQHSLSQPKMSQKASKKSIARSESVGTMLPEKEQKIQKFITITEKLVASKNDPESALKIAFDEVSSENLVFDENFTSALVERLSSDFGLATSSNLLEEISELLRIKGLLNGDSTGQFLAFFPI